MLKKKVLRMFVALLGAVMLLTAAGTGAAFADVNGNKVDVAEVEINDKNVASHTLASDLKPYTDYTVSDDLKTEAGNDLNARSAGFTTGANDFSQNGRYFIGTDCSSKWFDGVEVNTSGKKGYYLGWNASFSFVFNGEYKVRSGEETYSVLGKPTRVKFVLNQGTETLKSICNVSTIAFYDGNDKLLKTEPLSKYSTDDWLNVDEKTYISDTWSEIDSGYSYKIFDVTEKDIPSNTAKITVAYSYQGDCWLTNPQAAWDTSEGPKYKTVTFTDTEPSDTWLQLSGAGKTDKNDEVWHGWYSAQEDQAKITIPLDGNHFKKQDGKRYKLDGVMDSIQCVIAGHNGCNASNVEIFVSENGTDWKSIGKANEYIIWPPVLPGFESWLWQQWIKLDKSALGENARYVRFNLGKYNGILQPTVTYTAPVERYEINDVTYTANGEGTTTAAGKVYFNFDGDKQTAAFTVITAAYNDGVLSDVKADTFKDVKKGSAAEFSQTVAAGNTTSIRTYVFESMASLKPIADMYR